MTRRRTPRALLVVANKAALTTGDTWIKNRLVGLGCTVDLLNDTDPEPSSSYSVIAIADSSSAGNLTPTHKYKANTAPRLCCSSAVAVDWEVYTATGTSTTTGTVIMLDGFHPASGRLPVTSSAFTISTDTTTNNMRSTAATSIVASGTQIAKVNGGNPCIAAFDKGAVVASGITTERIVSFGIRENAFAHPGTHLGELFDASINWLLYRDRRPFLVPGRKSTFTAPAGAIIVDCDNGLDTNAGTVAAPVKTLVHAAALVASGGTVALRGAPYCTGMYRESLGSYSAKHFTLQGYQNEVAWIKGTQVIPSSNFVASGTNFKWAGGYNPTALNGKRAAQARQQTITDAATVSGSNIITTTTTVMSTSRGFAVSQPVSGAGIPANSVIKAVTSTTTFTIKNSTTGADALATATAGGVSVTFTGSNAESLAGDLTDQLVFDNETFYQVDTLAKMTARTFFIDYTVGAAGDIYGAGPFDVYIQRDPTGHVVEMSQYVTFGYLAGSAAGMIVRGLGIAQFSSNYDNDNTGKAAALGFNCAGCTADQLIFCQQSGHDLQSFAFTQTYRDMEFAWTGYAPITGNTINNTTWAGLLWAHDMNRNRYQEVSGVSSHIGAFKTSNTQGFFQASGAGAAYWGAGTWQAANSAQPLGAIVIQDPYGLHGWWVDLHCSHNGMANIHVHRPGKNNHGGTPIWHEYGDTAGLYVNCTALMPYGDGMKTGESVSGRFWHFTVKDPWSTGAHIYGDSRQDTTGAEMCNGLIVVEDPIVVNSNRLLYINDQVTAHTQSVAGMVSKVDGNGYARAVSSVPTNAARVDTTDVTASYANPTGAGSLNAAFAALEPASVTLTGFTGNTGVIFKHNDDLRQVATSVFLAAGVGVGVPADVAAMLTTILGTTVNAGDKIGIGAPNVTV